jgi:hypothetical protein
VQPAKIRSATFVEQTQSKMYKYSNFLAFKDQIISITALYSFLRNDFLCNGTLLPVNGGKLINFIIMTQINTKPHKVEYYRL